MPDDKSNQEGDGHAVDSAQAVELVEPTMQHLLDHADVKHVFGRPVQHGEITLIPAAEVTVIGAFGAGYGVGLQTESAEGGGGGGGGGVKTLARPVAVVIVTPEGARVEPVIDLTKTGLAVITAWGFMLSIILRMRRRRPRKA